MVLAEQFECLVVEFPDIGDVDGGGIPSLDKEVECAPPPRLDGGMKCWSRMESWVPEQGFEDGDVSVLRRDGHEMIVFWNLYYWEEGPDDVGVAKENGETEGLVEGDVLGLPPGEDEEKGADVSL